jgi:predicted SnoaL-like aldol condensation-catalyzing enzyme
LRRRTLHDGWHCLHRERGIIMNSSKMRRWGASVIVAALACGALLAQLKNTPEEQKNEDFVLNMYREVLQYHHYDLSSKYMADDYIQHNANDPPGRQGLMDMLKERFPDAEPLQPEMKNKPVLVITKGNIVLQVTEGKAKDPANPSKIYTFNHFEMVRVADGKVREHWDDARLTPEGQERMQNHTSSAQFPPFAPAR